MYARRGSLTTVLAGAILAACASRGVLGPSASPPPEPKASSSPVSDEATSDAGASPPSAPPHYDVNHVLVTGQSLSVGVSGGPPLSLSQPFGNLMFNTGVMAGGEELEHFEPLIEGDNIPGSKVLVETMASAFANLVSELAREDVGGAYDLLLSVHGSGAKPYSRLKKGTKPYANGMTQVAKGRAISERLGKTYVVRAVATVHGESDHAENNGRYLANLVEWQSDYEADVKELTGQTEPVPMFQTQISSWTRLMKGTETSFVSIAQLEAHKNHPGKIVLVGPKYHLEYSKDGVHLTNEGYRHMGEDYAKVYRRVVVQRRAWEPVRPISTARDGAVITVKFAVPEPPLVLDTTLVVDPGNYGFEYVDSDDARPTISRVEVTSADTVVVTLSAPPVGEGRRLRYAFTGVRGARSGPSTGPRGNLRDSDATRSRSGHRLYNWCVHFDEPVP